MSTRMWPCRDTEVMAPSAAIVRVTGPVVTVRVGRPNRCASAGRRNSPLWPFSVMVAEPSGAVVTFPGPDRFSVMAFPVRRLVNVAVSAPVVRVVIDPSAALRILAYSWWTGRVTPTLNPQYRASRVKGRTGTSCHWGPRPARAGEAVSAAVQRAKIVASAASAVSRLMGMSSNLVGHVRAPGRGRHERCRLGGAGIAGGYPPVV